MYVSPKRTDLMSGISNSLLARGEARASFSLENSYLDNIDKWEENHGMAEFGRENWHGGSRNEFLDIWIWGLLNGNEERANKGISLEIGSNPLQRTNSLFRSHVLVLHSPNRVCKGREHRSVFFSIRDRNRNHFGDRLFFHFLHPIRGYSTVVSAYKEWPGRNEQRRVAEVCPILRTVAPFNHYYG